MGIISGETFLRRGRCWNGEKRLFKLWSSRRILKFSEDVHNEEEVVGIGNK